jgi:DNA-binding transcriptional LysR family regulator
MAAMELDPVHLRSFLAIVRYGGYHRAAEALHLTQPAVSRHMRQLEGQLGQPLFERRGRGVELTTYGERAAAELAEVLAAHDRAVARLQRSGAEAGPFVLGVIENLVDPVLPDLLQVVREQIGDRPLQLRVDRSFKIVERLGRGEVDAAIVVDPRDAPDPIELGAITLRWWASPALAAADPLPDPLPLVVYDPPCAAPRRRPRARGGPRHGRIDRRREPAPDRRPRCCPQRPRLRAARRRRRRAARRHGRPAGRDDPGRLWLLLAAEHRGLAAPLKAALWRAATRRAHPAAA